MELKFYDESYQQEVLDYQLTDLSFTALPSECLKENQKRADYKPVLCIENERIVCFFVLDSGSDKFNYCDNPSALLLRAFSTDSREIRKGYAKQCLLLLPQFLQNECPECDEIILGVNEGNQVAMDLYKKVNFIETNKLFLGPRGYQKIMSLKI